MRWKGFITLAVLLAIVAIVSILFIDKWIESALEKTGQVIVGAKVEIDNFDFRLLNLSMEWDRLQVTDSKNTMQNLIETGRAAYKMNPPALFRKRFIIEEMSLENFRSGTPRAYDGALPKKVKKRLKREKPDMVDKVKTRLSGEVKKLPVVRFDASVLKKKLNLDSLIATVDLETVNRVDSVKNDIIQTSAKWETFYKEFHPENDLKKIRADFSSVDPEKIKTVPELIAVLEKVQSAQKTLNGISETVDIKYNEIQSDLNRISSYPENAKNWINEDYQKILQKAKLPDLRAKNIGKLLFGPTLVNQVDRYLNYLQMIRKIIPKKSDKPKKEKKPRMVGQTIQFPDRHNWPTFLIKKIFVSGQTGITDEQPGIIMSGEVKGITSQPWIYGRPTIIDLKGIKQDQRSVIFNAFLDHTTETPTDSLNFIVKNISLNNLSISKTPYLPSTIKKGRANFITTTRIRNENLLAIVDITAREIDFDFSNQKSDDIFIKIVQDVVSRMKILTMHAEISGNNDVLDFKLDSNIDEHVSKELKRLTSEKLTETQNRIKSKLNSIRDKKLAELNKIFSEKRKEIEDPISEYQNEIRTIQTSIEEKIKIIKDDIEKRKKTEEDKLEKKAKDLLENILKK